nr:hypothetical protein B0A51_02493 [Rachicladosporium sp. CCFEE 5018]
MPSLNTRASYLSLTPVNISLTAGTNIPTPDSPPPSPNYFPTITPYKSRPPTAGGGPLSSHPTTPEDTTPGAWPRTPEADTKPSHESTTRVDSLNPPRSTNSRIAPQSSASPPPPRDMGPPPPRGPRRLFSLTSLRTSFSASRTSLRPSTPAQQPTSLKRPSSPTTSFAPSTTPSYTSTLPNQSRPQRTKSGSWFRRKSGMFGLNDVAASSSRLEISEPRPLGSLSEDFQPGRPGTGGSKRVKSSHASDVPTLDVGFSNENGLGSGELGWDEGMFGRG